ncbi:MAG TPA: hypothetical protein VIP10_13775 [Burkholderiaceae bacterium]
MASIAAALLAAAPGARAANADLQVTVTPIPNDTAPDGTLVGSAVSLSRLSDPSALFNAYLAVEVQVTSSVTNVNNAVVFDMPVNVVAGTPAAFRSIVGTACGAGSVLTDARVTCRIGQLRGGQTSRFVVIYRTPESGTAIELPWTLSYSTLGSQSSTPSGTTFSGSARTDLITWDDPQVSRGFTSFVPQGAPSDPAWVFFTGRRNGTALTDATGADKLTAKLSIPSGVPGLTTVTVDQNFATTGQTNDTLTTNTTQVTIPAPKAADGSPLFFGQRQSGDPVTPILITLQRDASTIKTFQAIDRVPIYYTAQPGEPKYPFEGLLMMCRDLNQPAPNADHPVCIDARVPLTKKNAAGQDVGDWRFILKALQNGVSRW